MRTAGILAALALSIAALHGQARGDAARAWAAARAGLPADTKVVIGVDVATVQKTQLFATFYPKLHDQPDIASLLDAIKDGCKLDPLAHSDVARGTTVVKPPRLDDPLSGVERGRDVQQRQPGAHSSASQDASPFGVDGMGLLAL